MSNFLQKFQNSFSSEYLGTVTSISLLLLNTKREFTLEKSGEEYEKASLFVIQLCTFMNHQGL